MDTIGTVGDDSILSIVMYTMDTIANSYADRCQSAFHSFVYAKYIKRDRLSLLLLLVYYHHHDVYRGNLYIANKPLS